MENKENLKYPYTYAADFIRSIAGYNEDGSKLSRSDAARIRVAIANAIGMDDKELACVLAEYYFRQRDEIIENHYTDFAKKIV